MKAQHLLFLPVFLFLNFSLFAQTKPKDPSELAQTYSDYFSLNREAVFLHLNKTALAPQEELWFAAYAFSPQFYLPNSTTNLHVNVYNSDGKLMEAKTISMAQAKGQGFFELNPDNFPPGDYVIQAGTKYMQNFKEDATFSQSFRILGETAASVVPREYDLQLLPEGGHLVNNVYNSVGVKIIDNLGKGVAFNTGQVLNSQDEVVSNFKSNRFGISKFNFRPQAGQNYKVNVELRDGKVISMPVPQPEEKGMVLASTSLGDKMLFNFKTNEETFQSLAGKTFMFAFHKDGAMKALSFMFSEVDMSANLTIDKSALHKGVNTITVFNEEMEPVLERLVFNRDSINRKQISAEFKRRDLDSLVIGLSAKEKLEAHSMSISVLPAETVAYKPDNNIFSAFYLEPYLQGDVENGGYYFSDKVSLRRRNYDLDLLLLTQGWSKYSWDNIFRNQPREKYAHEQGFILSGNIANRKLESGKTLFIGSPTENISIITNVEDNNTFKAENLFIRDSAQVSFSILKDKRSRSKLGVLAKVLPARDTVGIDPPKYLQLRIKEDIEETGKSNIPDNFISGAEELNTVYLENKVLTEIEENRELERKLNRGDMYGRTEVFTEEEAKMYGTLFSFLQDRGFEARSGNMYSRRELMRKPPGASLGLPGQPAIIFIDGMESDLVDLKALRPIHVKSIYTNPTGFGSRGFGRGGATGGGLIEIITNNSYSRNSENATTLQLANGFAAPKEFYAPKYSSYNNEQFRSYGVIGWLPYVSLEDQNEIQIFDTRQPVRLFIEGIAADGALISGEILIEAK